jgi:hypothetical protein
MKAILKVKGGFTKEYEVQTPPPRDIRVAEMDENAAFSLKESDVIEDITIRQRLFLLRGVASPVEWGR